MIALAFFGGFLVLMLVAAIRRRRARRRGLRPGVPERDVLKREGTSNHPSRGGGTPEDLVL